MKRRRTSDARNYIHTAQRGRHQPPKSRTCTASSSQLFVDAKYLPLVGKMHVVTSPDIGVAILTILYSYRVCNEASTSLLFPIISFVILFYKIFFGFAPTEPPLASCTRLRLGSRVVHNWFGSGSRGVWKQTLPELRGILPLVQIIRNVLTTRSLFIPGTSVFQYVISPQICSTDREAGETIEKSEVLTLLHCQDARWLGERRAHR